MQQVTLVTYPRMATFHDLVLPSEARFGEGDTEHVRRVSDSSADRPEVESWSCDRCASRYVPPLIYLQLAQVGLDA